MEKLKWKDRLKTTTTTLSRMCRYQKEQGGVIKYLLIVLFIEIEVLASLAIKILAYGSVTLVAETETTESSWRK